LISVGKIERSAFPQTDEQENMQSATKPMQDRDSFAPMDLSLIKSKQTDIDYEEHSPSMGIEKRGKPQDEVHTPYMKDRIQRDSSDMSSNASLVKL